MPGRSPITQAIEDAGREDLYALAGPYSFPAHPLPGGPDDHVVITFEAPSKPLSVNATNGRHYATTHTDKLLWAHAAREAFTAAGDRLAAFRGHRIELTFCLPLVNWKQADGGNYTSGISVKAAQDGIAKSGTLIPRDTSEWLRTDCVFWHGGPEKNEVRVKVAVAEAPWDGS